MNPQNAKNSNLDNKQKLHYFLILGEVAFLMPDQEEEGIHVRRLNGIYSSTERHMRLKHLARCQEILQMNLQRQMAQVVTKPVDVKEVIIHSVSYLGEHTQREFFEGMEHLLEGQQQK